MTELQASGLIVLACSIAAFVAMHFTRTRFDYMAMLYLATILGIIATAIGILT